MTDPVLEVITPMWGRSDLLQAMATSLAATTPVPFRLLLIVSPNDPDGLVEPGAAIATTGGLPEAVEIQASWSGGTPGDYARKMNLGYRSGIAPLMFLGANDIVFRPDWYEAASALMVDPVGVVGTNDMGNPRTMSGQHSTHSLVSRAYIDRFGTIDDPTKMLHEGYWHEFVDDEFVRTAQHRRAWAHATDAFVEHLHPHWGKRESDASDARFDERMAQGRALYSKRCRLWGVPTRVQRAVTPTSTGRPQRVQGQFASRGRPRIVRAEVRRNVSPSAPPVILRRPPDAPTVSIVVATFGEQHWRTLAERRALPSARAVGANEVISVHGATLASARNDGAYEATGEWLCFLDADDELDTRYLDAMSVAMSQHSAPALLVPAVAYVGLNGPEAPRVLNDGRPLLDINRAVVGSLVRRSMFNEVGGFRELPIYEDWDLWLRCERAGADLVDVPHAVYRAWRSPGSRNSGAEARATYQAIREEEKAARCT